MLRVVKVGGSLFDLPDLAPRIDRWLTSQPPARTVLVAGGGELADVIRRGDQRHGLGEAAAHDLCIDLLGASARWLAAIGNWPLAADLDDLRCHGDRPIAVADCRGIFSCEQVGKQSTSLPRSWDTTTDSLAAQLALWLAADELVLLKSLPASHGTLTELAASGYVDRSFPIVAHALPLVRFVNLRFHRQNYLEHEYLD